MSGDTGRRVAGSKRPRSVEQATVGWPAALRQLNELLFEVYLAASAPTLDEIAADISGDDRLPGSPGRDTVGRVLGKPVLPPNQHDVVSVARVLAARARWDADDLAVRVRDLWVQARLAKGAGRPLEEIASNDEYVVRRLEVHQSLDVDGARDRLGPLPAYVPRTHDARLRDVVAEAKAGRSGIAVLVGASSTGKTRALWEAVRTLPSPWRLWHPLSTGGPAAVLAELSNVAPRTVVWLNEAQNYLDSGAEGEQAAAGLRDLLTDPAREPVLVLATLWTEHWDTLTLRRSTDHHGQARQLLADHKIDVPDAFTPVELSAFARASSDARLTEAIRQAQDAQITQYLAGVPVLLDRYAASRGVTRALIHAAMDARRLGAGLHLPLGWLVDAAPGYLTEAEYHALPDDWLPQALAYATELCNGTPGILSPIKTGPSRNERPRRRPAISAPPSPQHERPGPHYLVAEYLDQYGRDHRAQTIPPIGFWTAAARHAHPADWHKLATAALRRGLYRDAAQLHKFAVAHGTPDAAVGLVSILLQTQPEDTRPLQWAAARVSDSPWPVAQILTALEGRSAQHVNSVLKVNPAATAKLDSPWRVSQLLRALGRAEATAQMELLAERAAAGIPVDDAAEVSVLLQGLSAVGATEAMKALADRAAPRFRLTEPRAAAGLLQTLHDLGAHDQAAIVAHRAAASINIDDPGPVVQLLGALQSTGMHSQVAVLAERAAADTPIDSPSRAVGLLTALTDARMGEHVKVVAERVAASTVIDNPREAAVLLRVMYGAGQQHHALALAERAAGGCVLKYPKTVAELLPRGQASWKGMNCGWVEPGSLLCANVQRTSPAYPGIFAAQAEPTSPLCAGLCRPWGTL
ncbi:hypothetical protein ABZZ74_47030 [Streptomyces sp. NPDC006476]|uniref:hypothetical protein n=1 Tax=Streptomyces sp. NPDC006476 TaxID=3157175 RepID=UPI0033A67394